MLESAIQQRGADVRVEGVVPQREADVKVEMVESSKCDTCMYGLFQTCGEVSTSLKGMVNGGVELLMYLAYEPSMRCGCLFAASEL